MIALKDEEDGGEPVPGLPERLPEGEAVLWRGSPKPLAFAARVFRFRWLAVWFGLAAAWRAAAMSASGASNAEIAVMAATALGAALAAFALLILVGGAMARASLFTLTNRRLVMRYGAAIRKYVNLPFASIEAVALKPHADGTGDIAFKLKGGAGAGFLHLWPHARPFRISNPEPTLRSMPEAELLAGRIAAAMKADAPGAVELARRGRAASRGDAPAALAGAADPAL